MRSPIVLPNPRGSQDSRHPFIMTCSEPNCVTRLASRSAEHAQWQWDTHLCPWTYDTSERIQFVKNSKSLFALQFAELDRCIEEFMDPETSSPELKAAITAHAFHIRLWMQPIFADIEAVKREGMKRYRLHETGEPTETPGVDYDWRPGTPTLPGSKPVPVSAMPAQTISVSALDQDKRAKVMKMHKSGNFELPVIASLTGLTQRQVADIIAEEGD